ARDQDEPARNALPLDRRHHARPLENNPRTCCLAIKEVSMFFRFPADARWNPDLEAVEFGIGVGEYEGVVRIPRRAFQRLLDQSPTPERCLEAYYLQRTRLELIAERKARRRQLTRRGWSACFPLSQ